MIVVTGAGGQLGTAFREVWREAHFLNRGDLDLAGSGIAETLDAYAPSAIVNCAAYTAVDAAESDEATASQVNGRAVGTLAAYAARRRIPLVTFSSDYVFAGTAHEPYVESSPTGPINAYGRTKLEGERAALREHPDALVVRTSWVVSATHPNFVASILRLSAERDSLSVVADQHGCPTIALDLARATARALEAGVTGLLHLTNRGATTWFGLAQRVVELSGRDPAMVEPCATEDYPTAARRPAYSVLGSERLPDLGIGMLPHWEESLPGVVAAQLARRV